jgi:hypothetical protein
MVDLHRMHAAFEFTHVDRRREVRITTTMFSTVKGLSQQRVQKDKQDQHNVLRSATQSITHRHEQGAG